MPIIQALHTPHKCVVSMRDGIKMHVSLEVTKELKALGVEVVVFPQHITYVIQTLDKGILRSLKNSFSKHEGKWKTLHNHRAPGRASFVCFWTTHFHDSVIPKNILSKFHSCDIAPFNPDNFLVNCAQETIHQEAPPAGACPPVSSCCASPSLSDTSSRPSSEKCDASTQWSKVNGPINPS